MRGLRHSIYAQRKTVRSLRSALTLRPGVAAIVALGVAWGLVMHQMGWAQMAHYDQVQAFSKGEAQIDQWHWDTNDKAWVERQLLLGQEPRHGRAHHPALYGDPGLGGDRLARAAVSNASQTAHPKWYPIVQRRPARELRATTSSAGSAFRRPSSDSTPIVWALTLLAAVIPAILLLLLVRWAADRFVPGYGTAAAITLGLATVVMTFAAEFFSHVISAASPSRRSAC